MNAARLPYPHGVGVRTGFEFALRFHLWAQQAGDRLDVRMIREHWKVSRATAYRWLNGYRAALGQP
jgi:hypothetical protein